MSVYHFAVTYYFNGESMQSWQDFQYSASDGLLLAGRKYGWENRERTAVVCLAGLSRNSRDFHEFAKQISGDKKAARRVLTLDYRGRGRSSYDDWKNYNPIVEAGDVVDGMMAAGLDRAHFVGTSRGGMVTMILAALKPGILGSIVFNDIGPEIDGVGLIRIKKMLETGHYASDWQAAIDQIRKANEKAFPKLSDKDWERQARQIFVENDNPKLAKHGKLVRDFDERLVETIKAIDLDAPLPQLWPQFTGLRKNPLMLVWGKNSDLLKEEHIQKMREIHPGMLVHEVKDAGHAPDIGEPSVVTAIGDFLKKSERR